MRTITCGLKRAQLSLFISRLWLQTAYLCSRQHVFLNCAQPLAANESNPSLYASFPLQDNHQTHHSQHDLLQPRVFAQEDSNIADKGNEADYASDHILLAVQEGLALSVELGIVCKVVVTLGEKAKRGFAGAKLAYALEMHISLVPLRSSLSVRYPPLKGKWATHSPPYLLTTRCTMGMSLPFTLYTTTSPICVSRPRFHRNSRSPL